MKIFLLLLLCVCFYGLYGQHSNFERRLKMYMNVDYANFERNYPEKEGWKTEVTGWDLDLGRLSPAISFEREKLFLEAEVSKLLFGAEDEVTIYSSEIQDIVEPIAGSFKTNLEISLRMEAGINFFNTDKVVRPILSLGLQPYFSFGSILPKTSQSASIHYRNGGVLFQILPRLQLAAKGKLTVELVPAIVVADFNGFYERGEDPGLRFEEQIFRQSELRFFPQSFGFRMGVGYRI